MIKHDTFSNDNAYKIDCALKYIDTFNTNYMLSMIPTDEVLCAAIWVTIFVLYGVFYLIYNG